MHSLTRRFSLCNLVLIVLLVLGLVGYSPMVAPRNTAWADPPPPLPPTEAIDDALPIEPGADPSPISPTPPPTSSPVTRTIHLKSRQFAPTPNEGLDASGLERLAQPDQARVHVLVQLDFIPRQAAKDALEAHGLELLAYVPDYAWIASLSVADAAATLDQPGVVWAGALTVEDKLDPAIVADRWGEWNLTPDNTVAVYVSLHKDEGLDAGRALVEAHGGAVKGQVVGINMLVVEMPKENITALAAEDAVQWIEPAAPPLEGVNDGSRPHIGVDVVQAAPYNLDGTYVDVLVYDSGQAGDHVDFGTRLIHGDSDFVSDHSTHVAGTVGGSGANSAAQGGSALQWRGMAPNADLISYGTAYPSTGYIFYQNVPDIEHDWAQAQNTYGADIGTASLGSNIYSNYYPGGCSIMGKYGAASVLIDQIVRGGNSVVGIGDKYIATWAAGNERGWSTSCTGAGGGYGIVAPPAGAKNPIHVGGSNTNNTTQYAHTSWGPTEDGRLKPIVTAGACQTTGDYGITSTDNNPVDAYTTMCGTSMATPAVAGGIALMLQHYRDVYNTSGRFWPSTAKALLMQTAHDEGNPGPDYQWGYGLVDIHAAVDLISRKGFRQESIDEGEIDVYSLIVPNDDDDLRVSLAWDDYEATENANPTLINDLDLELVAPDGTVWEPWVLDPDNPTTNATRDVNTVDNQEQVEVPAASVEIGTWLVRVHGTEVPEGPQDYSLACEGCQPLNVGVCQGKLDGTSTTMLLAAEGEEAALSDLDAAGPVAPEAEGPPTPESPLTEGEQWQRELEAQIVTQEERTVAEQERAEREGLEALETARQDGPEAVVALLNTLRGPALDAVLDEIQEAQERLAESAPPPPLETTAPVSEAEEKAAVEAQIARDAQNRAEALSVTTDPDEGQWDEPAMERERNPATPQTSSQVTLTVGSGCDYATIGAAIAAANPGDMLLIEGDVTFEENVTIPISLTLQGGYDGCESGSSDLTTVDGGASGRVFDIYRALDVTLENFEITNGNIIEEGGGIRFAVGTGTGNLTLNNVYIHNNIGYWGGGLWVGPDAQVTGYDVQIYDNTANAYGGGVRLYGGRATFDFSNIHDNAAPYGGGVYATQEDGYSPNLNLSVAADVYDNQALTGNGLGGGVYMRQGHVWVAACSDLHSNDAIVGGGAYLVTTTLTVDGDCSEVNYNTATDDGGGVYAIGSGINLDEEAAIEFNDAGTDGSGNGGGAYLDDSNLYSDKASINNNETDDFGGGIYATNGSRVDMDLGTYTCLGPDCSRLYNNVSSSSYGGGVYLNGSYAWLDNTYVEGNRGTLGGGIYAYESSVYVDDSLFARNNATSGTGDGVRLYTGANMTGQGNTFAYNESGGAGTGRAIDLYSADLTLGCSIIWGHSSSINATGEDVTYSDVQWGYTGEGNLNVNPLFVSPAGQDYHLQTTSPVIDRCLSGGLLDYDAEKRPIVLRTDASPYDMGADEASTPRVGLGGESCEYGTVQQAINAAQDGDTIYVSAGVYFENLSIISKDITLEGGYNSTCSSATGGATRIEGSAGSDSTASVSNATVTLRNLDIAWGTGAGGGIETSSAAQVTLDGVTVLNNHGSYGGGVYIGSGSVISLTNNSDIQHNTASVYGGGARVFGTLVGTETTSDISYNCAPHGGGVSVPGGVLRLEGSDIKGNEAADPTGQGGGIYVIAGGLVTLQGNVWVYESSAYDGAGIYIDGARVDLSGGASLENHAKHYGGGVMLTNGGILQSGTQGWVGYNSSAGYQNTAQYGGGIYAQDSTVHFAGRIVNNEAANAGGGIDATGSTILLRGARVGGTGVYDHNSLGTNGTFGAGIYLTNGSHATLDNTDVISNTFERTGFTYAGGVYLINSSFLTMTNGSSVEQHATSTDPSSRGGGIYADSSTVTLDDSRVISNTSSVGGGVRLWNNNTLNLLNGAEVINNRTTAGAGGGVAAGSGVMDINISDATFRDNTASTDGGAIYITDGTLDFTESWDLRWNHADGNGGAIAVVGTADLDMYAESGNSYLGVNTAGGNGGALYVGNSDSVTMRASDGNQINFNTNSATGNGGAFYADNDATIIVQGRVEASSNNAGGNGGAFYLGGSTVLGLLTYANHAPRVLVNRADNGGAVYATGGSGVVSLGAEFGSSSNGNQAQAGSGGAVYLENSELLAYDSTFQNSEATNHGGAIYASNTSTMTIGAIYSLCDPLLDGQCSSFYSNIADSDDNDTGNGGAIHVTNSTLAMYNTYLHRNSAMLGGAIYQTGSNATSQINNTLVYSNTIHGAAGAGIRAYQGTFTMTHTTLANNTGGDGFTGEATQAAHNSIAWGNSGDGFVGTFVTYTCNIDQSGNIGTNVDPKFVDPVAHDYHLLGNSPAIDQCAIGLTPDLDNVPRPVPAGGLYDMGAYEYPYAITFVPDNEGVGLPGTVVTYAHTLTNAGGTADTFTLTTHSTQGWTVDTDPAPTATLSAGATTPVVVSITVPAGVPSGTVDTTFVTATSAADPALTAAVIDTTTIGFAPGVIFAPNHVITNALDTTYPHTHTLTNAGNHTDTFNLDFDTSAGWGSLDTPGPFELGPMASTVVTVMVTVPSGVAESDTSVVTATSDGGAGPAVVRDVTSAFSPGVAFTPDSEETLSPDNVVTYTHTLTNTGDATDTFHLAWDSSLGWATLLDPGPFTLVDGETQDVRVRVTVPPGTAGMTETTVVTATSAGGAGPTAVRDTTAVFAAGLAFEPDHDETVAPGTTFTYTHHLTNTGAGPDTFDVGLASSTQGWTTLVDSGPFPLNPGQRADVRVRVDVPSGAGGLTDVTVITATSQAGALAALSDVVTDTTFAGQTYGAAFLPSYQQDILPGTTLTYTHRLTNTGNGTDTFSLAFTTSAGWATLLDSGPFTLPAGLDTQVRVRVEVPAGAGGMEDVATVVATSQLSPTVSVRVTDTTTALYVPGTMVEPDHAQTLSPGDAFTYTHWLTNTGTGSDWFDLAFATSQGWTALLDPGPYHLNAGESVTLSVRVDVPPGSGGLIDTAVLTASSQTGGLSDTATDVTTVTFTAGVDIGPDLTHAAPPSSTYIHLHTLTNTGNGPDTFTLDLSSSHGRATLLDAGPITLGADETASVRVSVTVPGGIVSGTLVDVSVVTATSQTDPTASDAASATTRAAFAPGLDFAPPDRLTTGAAASSSHNYTHTLTNRGNYTDTFVLTYTSSAGWGSLTTPGPFTLGRDESTVVQVQATVPGDGIGFDTTIVTATSQGGAGPARVRDTTAAFDPDVTFVSDQSRWLNPGESYTYTHWLTNTGTSTDTIDLSLDSSRGWTRLLRDGPFTLASGAAISVSVQVTAPVGSGGLTDVTMVEAATLNGAGPTASVTDTTNVTYTPDVALVPNYAESVPAGNAIQYTHRLTNTGDGPDTFSLAIDSSQGWATLLDPGPFPLAAGGSAQVRVEVSVPTDTLPFVVDVTTITATAAVGGVSATATDTTTVACESIAGADFGVTPQTILVNRPVTFTGRVAGGSPTIAYAWDLDDGDGIQTGNPILHTFVSTGTYTIVMTATNPCPSTGTMSKTIAVVNAPDISVTPTTFDFVQGVGYVSTRTLTIGNGGTTNLIWNLTESPTRTWMSESPVGGSVGSSGEQVVDIVFDSNGLGLGTYTSMLRIGSNDPDEPIVSVPVTMTVTDCQPVIEASFEYAPSDPEVEEIITFSGIYTPSSATTPIDYSWDLGSGTIKSGATVTHSYAVSDTYAVTLRVTNPCTSPAVEYVGYVTVVEGGSEIYLPLVLRNS